MNKMPGESDNSRVRIVDEKSRPVNIVGSGKSSSASNDLLSAIKKRRNSEMESANNEEV